MTGADNAQGRGPYFVDHAEIRQVGLLLGVRRRSKARVRCLVVDCLNHADSKVMRKTTDIVLNGLVRYVISFGGHCGMNLCEGELNQEYSLLG